MCMASSARFARIAAANAADAAALAATGVRAGRPRSLDDADLPGGVPRSARRRGAVRVLLLQEWLARQPAWTAPLATPAQPASGCCRTARSAPPRRLPCGLAVSLRPPWPPAGGPRRGLLRHGRHLRPRGRAQGISEQIYGLSWRRHVAEHPDRLLATGYLLPLAGEAVRQPRPAAPGPGPRSRDAQARSAGWRRSETGCDVIGVRGHACGVRAFRPGRVLSCLSLTRSQDSAVVSRSNFCSPDHGERSECKTAAFRPTFRP